MAKDEIGNRMKENYENRSKTYLTRRTPVVIRIDGCHFHTFTKHFNRPFDQVFIRAMQETTKALCKHIQGCKIGFVQSDEISLLLTDFDTFSTAAWFDYAVQKISSVSASMASMYFNQFFKKSAEDFLYSPDRIVGIDYDKLEKAYKSAIEIGAYFDARCFNIPEREVCNYFIWRQQDATRNSILGMGYKYFSQKALQNKNCSEIQEMLFQEEGINWNDIVVVKKRGTCVKRVKKQDGTYGEWMIDYKIPIFTQDRNYIEELITYKEE